ncbi:MAG: hypothetical protein ABIH23_07600 [bacterium]
MKPKFLSICLLLFVIEAFGQGVTSAAIFDSVSIVLGDEANLVERNSGQLLHDRIGAYSEVALRIEREGVYAEVKDNELAVFLGLADHHGRLASLLNQMHVEPPNEKNTGPEGFLLHSLSSNGGQILLAAGVDERGVLYAVGEILRRMDLLELTLEFPSDLHLRTAPAFEVRGTQFDQGGKMVEVTGARHWTEKEQQTVILDYALAGANTFEVGVGLAKDSLLLDFMKSFGLKTLVHYGPNTGAGPPEWQAEESIGRPGYLCPSVPEAREYLLRKCENSFKNSPTFDCVRFYAGDGGGCECDRCDPYGGTYIRLCSDMAEIIHRYHPETEIFATNQKLDNADDQAIFDYLNEKPRPWLRAFCYAPGSDAMTWQQGRRQTHRMDLFRYPGFGPFDRYLNEILHQLPPSQSIVFFNEITHWYYSQYGYVHFQPPPDIEGETPPHWSSFIYNRHPDPYLVMVYERQTFYAWPRYYHYVFNETMRYGIGDVTHSSGHHDHFNQWMWQRLMWSPHTSVEDVVAEYARTWFGREAAPLMAEALFQLEKNLEDNPSDPLPTRDGIDRYYLLVKQAGWKIPEAQFKDNWLWRQYMQKAALDKYTQLAVRAQLQLQKRIENRLAEALQSGDIDAAIAEALMWLRNRSETEEMRLLREEAGRLGEESNEIFGVRNTGYFNLEHDFIGLGWTRKQLGKAKDAADPAKRRLLGQIVNYEDAREGGFYDNAGDPEGAFHLVNGTQFDHGQPYWRGALSESNRPSQRPMAFTAHEKQGVTFEYADLDQSTQYRVRFTLVRPIYQERYAMRMLQKSESIYADEFLLVKDLELPEYESEFFEFDIPKKATKDGSLTIRFEKSAGIGEGKRTEVEIWRNSGGWGTLVSEVWLMKMPSDGL